jgi:hypothetical protein
MAPTAPWRFSQDTREGPVESLPEPERLSAGTAFVGAAERIPLHPEAGEAGNSASGSQPIGFLLTPQIIEPAREGGRRRRGFFFLEKDRSAHS